ncbi:MAG: hypothetical protein R2809_11035 [Flavobacteriales bacterium]
MRETSMEIIEWVFEILDENLIYCLIPIILTLFIVELVFKSRFETKKTLNLVRWTIIAYTIISWTVTLVGVAAYPDDSTIVNRLTGTHKVANWITLLSTLILPVTLLIKKVATKFWYVLLVAFCLKIGSYLERFVIFTTNLHRDHLPDSGNAAYRDSMLYIIGTVFLQGIAIAILTLGIFEMTKKKKNYA